MCQQCPFITKMFEEQTSLMQMKQNECKTLLLLKSEPNFA